MWANIWLRLQPRQLGSHLTNMVCVGRSPIHLLTKHSHYLDRLQWCCSLTGHHGNNLSVAVVDSINTGILVAQGLPVRTPHHVFLDHDIYLDVFDTVHVEQAISTSIEAIFILLVNLIWTFDRTQFHGMKWRR